MSTDPATGTARQSRLRRNWPWLASLAIVLVTAGILIGSALHDDALSAHPGDVVFSNYVMPKGYRASVKLPIGTLGIKLTKALTSVRNDDAMEGREPPADGSFVGIDTSVGIGALLPTTGSDATGTTQVELIVGAHHYPVPPLPTVVNQPYAPGALTRAWVAVDGVPDDVRVRVGYDGVNQTVDPRTGKRDTGRAAPLYRASSTDPLPASARQKSCGAPALTPGFSAPDAAALPRCLLGATAGVPYVRGLGWAPAGKSWLFVDVTLDRSLVVDWHGGPAQYHSISDFNTPGDLTLYGAQPGGGATKNAAPGVTTNSPSDLVGFFAVPDHLPSGVRLGASVEFGKLVRAGGRSVRNAPVAPDVTVSWKAPVHV